MNIKLFASYSLIATLLLPCVAVSNTLEQQRSDFLQAELAANQGNEATFLQLSNLLADYPLYPYLQYQWLSTHLTDTYNVQAFLSAYPDSRYAPLLREKWLDYLASEQRWQDVVQNYQPSDDTALQCQFHWANYQLTRAEQSIAEAKRLWQTGDTLPKECDALLNALSASPVMTPELIWQRFVLALEKDHTTLATYLQGLMAKSEQGLAGQWLQIHKNPTLITQNPPSQAKLLAHGVLRLAKTHLDAALAVWDSNKSLVQDVDTAQKVERGLGLALAKKRDSRAFERLNLVQHPDEEAREWKVRAALLAQNWQQVNGALTDLTPEERQQPKWQYWQARALSETGDSVQASVLLDKLAQDRSFYGFMAADSLNKPYAATDKPVPLIGNELETLANETDFKVAKEFKELHRELDAKRQWTFAVKKLPKAKALIAAKLAQNWQWDQVAIVTLVQADYWDDLALRFPTTYADQVQNNANLQGLDPAVVFGLIRQESMLDKNAQSPVGARGLMQIMPDTGKQIARKMNEPWQSAESLFNPEVNIKYGSFYYKQLLDKFNGNFALAAAAYNAGPQRVNQWLPNQWMPADIWIETIPFKETRKYVTSVLSYAMIYSQRLQQNNLKIKNLLPDVPTS